MSGEDQQQNQPQNQQQPVQVSIPHGYQIKKHVQFKLADDKEPLQKVNNEDGSVGELFYVEKVKPDGQPKLGPDDQPILYLEKPHASDKQAQGLIEALSTALYGLIGPPNSAAKARVREAPESDDDSKITVVTKYAQRYRHVEERDCVATQTNLTVHLVMQYLFEDADLNCGNLLISSDNPKQTIRIDLGWSLADFGGLYSWGKTNFTGRPNKSNNHLFPISPLDLARFPNYIIAKPYNVFYFNKKTAESTAVLQQMSEDPAFTKTAHQYFLKALLFDKTLLDPVTHAFMLNGDDKSTVGDYLKDRFAALQRALMQVPAFRKNVCDDKIFSEYEENILAEFAAYNQEYENKLAKDKPEDKKAQYRSRLIDIEGVIKPKLKALRNMARLAEYIEQGNIEDGALDPELKEDFDNAKTGAKNALGCDFDPTNKYHQYAFQMALTASDTFDAKKLQDLLLEQTAIKLDHLNTRILSEQEYALSAQLKYIYLASIKKSPAEQSEMLFFVNQALDECLIKIDQGKREKNIFNLLENELKKHPKVSYLAGEISKAKLQNYFYESISNEVQVSTLKQAPHSYSMEVLYVSSELALGNNINGILQHAELSQTHVPKVLFRVAFNEATANCEKIKKITSYKIGGQEISPQLFQDLAQLMEEAVAYGKEKGDDEQYKIAAAYLYKIKVLSEVFLTAIEKKKRPNEIVNDMIAELKNRDAFLSEHSGFRNTAFWKWMAELINALQKMIVNTNDTATLKPWISTKTEREIKLEAAVSVIKPYATVVECKA